MRLENPLKTYDNVENRVFSCQFHAVFCPKYRRKLLTPPIAECLTNFILKKQKAINYKVLEINVLVDHVHLVLSIDPSHSMQSIIAEIKYQSSPMLRKEFPELKTKLSTVWNRAYFISTVGNLDSMDIPKWLQNQKNI